MPMARGIFQYNNGPHLHEYLNEFRTVLDDYDCVTIGEAPLITTKRALDFIGGKHPELDMMIPFQCMEGDCFLQDYSHHPFCLVKLKTIWQHWQKALHGKGWNLLYIENHDHPRVISRYGSEKYNTESGKALAASYLFQEGTPIVYQGQEIGMTNIYPETIDGYEDVQTINQYHHFATHKSEKKRMAAHLLGLARQRAHARAVERCPERRVYDRHAVVCGQRELPEDQRCRAGG